MEIKMNKEIQDYQESFFFGLSMRQSFFSLLAVAAAVGVYLGLKDILGTEITGWLCILSAAPFAGCGFFKYHQMTLEQFVWAWLKSEVLYPKRLVFRSENLYAVCLDEMIREGIRSCGDGAELVEQEAEERASGRQKEGNKRQTEKLPSEKHWRKYQIGRGDAVDQNTASDITTGEREV